MRRKVPAQVRLKKFLWVVLPGVLILLAGLAFFLGLSVYRITHPAPAQESANPSLFLLPAQDVRWTSTDGTEFAGWWIAGASDNACARVWHEPGGCSESCAPSKGEWLPSSDLRAARVRRGD